VDLTPETQRPYISGTHTNSAFERSLGGTPLSGIFIDKVKIPENQASTDQPSAATLFEFEIGKPGITRLFNYQLADQISWFLLFALGGLLIVLFYKKSAGYLNNVRKLLIFIFSLWLLIQFLVYSFTPFIHRYYLASLAPSIAGLTGIAISIAMKFHDQENNNNVFLPMLILSTGILQVIICSRYPSVNKVLVPLLLFFSVIVPFVFIIKQVREGITRFNKKLPKVILLTAFGFLFLTPFIWSFITTLFVPNPNIPFGGVNLAVKESESNNKQEKTLLKGIQWLESENALPRGLGQYLLDKYNGEKYLAVFPASLMASPLAIEMDKPILALGGFLGDTPAIEVKQLEDYFLQGDVKFILLHSKRKLPQEINTWVEAHCELIDFQEWSNDGRIPSSAVHTSRLFRYIKPHRVK
jgi:4-amino-4-deoxy-L-arabinose transferase-like glycosyltransferase